MRKSNSEVLNKLTKNSGQIAILIDPEKVILNEDFTKLIAEIENAQISFILVGGSTVTADQQHSCIARIKELTEIPVVIFPGSPEQIDDHANAIFFLNLISGRNPDYLIGHQVASVPKLLQCSLEIIPTAYILVDGGKETTVQRISKTQALTEDQIELALHTAIAGVLMGNQVVYLDAGSGAQKSINPSWIKNIREHIDNPIIVGGGVRTVEQVAQYFNAGANLVVIGNHVETNPEFLKVLRNVWV